MKSHSLTDKLPYGLNFWTLFCPLGTPRNLAGWHTVGLLQVAEPLALPPELLLPAAAVDQPLGAALGGEVAADDDRFRVGNRHRSAGFAVPSQCSFGNVCTGLGKTPRDIGARLQESSTLVVP